MGLLSHSASYMDVLLPWLASADELRGGRKIEGINRGPIHDKAKTTMTMAGCEAVKHCKMAPSSAYTLHLVLRFVARWNGVVCARFRD